MTIFDLDQSITVEFHGDGVDEIERKMLGLWALPEFSQANIQMRLENEQVLISIRKMHVTKIPFSVFDQLSVKELASIIIKHVKEKYL